MAQKAPRTAARPILSASARDVARRAREEVYRDHILKAAEKVFAEQGFDSAKLQDISRLAGLSMGSIYSLFAGKEALYSEIVHAKGNELHEMVKQLVAQHPDPVDALEALAKLYIDYFHDHPDFLCMQIRTGAAWALSAQYAGHQESVAQQIHELHRQIFAKGVASGVFIQEDPAYLARLLTGMDQIHLSTWVAAGMKESRESSTERFLRVVRKMFLR